MNDELIIPTKDRPGSYDAIETAKPDEPLFPIQGGDPLGPSTVLHWAKLAREEGLRLTGDHPEGSKEYVRGERLLHKATMAEQVAWAMQEYQRGHVPVEAKRATYNDDSRDPVAASAARSEREARIRAAAAMQNALAQIADQAELLATLGICDTEVAELFDVVGTLKCVAAEVEPRRGMERS